MLSACTKQTRADYNYVDELRSVNKLVLARMTVSKMATIDDLPLDDARGIKQTAAAMLDIIKSATARLHTHTIPTCGHMSTCRN